MTLSKKPECDFDSMEVSLYKHGWNNAIDAITSPSAQLEQGPCLSPCGDIKCAAICKRHATQPEPVVAHRLLRKTLDGEWKHDGRYWADGPPSKELVADVAAREGWRIECAYTTHHSASPLSGWVAVSDRLPLESDGEVLVRMRDGRCEIAWATYWHGASNAFAQWTFRDPDEDEAPTHWMLIPDAQGIKIGDYA